MASAMTAWSRSGQFVMHRRIMEPADFLVSCKMLTGSSVPPFFDLLAYQAKHTESDLRCCLAWCAERGLDPLAAQRPHLELYIRWMQEIRQFKPSIVSRRFSVAAGCYRPRPAGPSTGQ